MGARLWVLGRRLRGLAQGSTPIFIAHKTDGLETLSPSCPSWILILNSTMSFFYTLEGNSILVVREELRPVRGRRLS